MTKAQLLAQVKTTVRKIEPDADVLLFGSHARGRATPASDWDFLILINGPVDAARTARLRRQLYKVEWDSGEVLCSIVRNRRQWHSRRMRATPLYRNVVREGIAL
ncbi:MAG: hypothetical protein A3K19_17610 [Lentisphaerae bacterium RIFOXYB12_FULL_65_16]|nr:MAG: hypothetical protein A3K18_00560 [Lentisphaerae bacterium RIFOXYA12_64_32]OGV91514.1 MAG: hypothetical protein A3K19_17610 [Lentisphaerae bacterium RIFOXYB12_FULL_65_16]